MFKIKLTAIAKKELKKISELDKLKIGEVVEELKEDPFLGKPLSREFSGRFSCRFGVYRIIYKIDRQNKIINILSAGHRANIYN